MSTHNITKEMSAAQAIKDGLATITDDPIAIRDTLEGETNLQEMIRDLLVSIEEDQILIDGVKTRLSDLTARKSRFEKRVKNKRVILQQAMNIAELPSVETDVATASIKAKARSLMVIDEAAIPSEFFEPQAPKLIKRKVFEALKGRINVPGAELSNGGQTISIRRI